MFTGIVEEVGEFVSLEEKKDAWELRVLNSFPDKEGLLAGDSVSLNGCCLTLCEDAEDHFVFELLEETLAKTNLGQASSKALFNVERALASNGRLGGHFVSGHIDTCGTIQVFEEKGKNLYLEVHIPADYNRYLVDKGSVAVNGCSLTVCDVQGDCFGVWLIPHTISNTNLINARVGDFLNLEFDLLAKYVEKLVTPNIEKIG